MELPIDHFRLLGVNPNCDTQTVLRTLQQRLDRPPQDGFTQDGLQARAELLRASAELLSDEERRPRYEAELTSLNGFDSQGRERIPALEIPTSRELGGLLLLLEADQPVEAFELACRCLEPPQAPALGSGREADLTLLAALACEAAANSLHQQRRFETAAGVLQQGVQLLQRMGQLPERRQRLALLREALLPYRVLDLLSRDLAATADRQEGLQLLDQLVQRRGGLEGDLDPAFSRQEFQAFFSQIRQFLTVQEQVDLFSRWSAAGSAEAQRLTTLALTASGFAQRKPERLASASERLSAAPAGMPGHAGGAEPSATTWLQLLLGQVEKVPQLQGEQPLSLAELCQQCRSWLNREVLPGYRDVDADADLEAWFADRDVQAWIERQDRREGRLSGDPAAPPATASASAPIGGGSTDGGDPFATSSGTSEPFGQPLGSDGPEGMPGGDGPFPAEPTPRRRRPQLAPLLLRPSNPWLLAGGMAIAVVLAGLLGLLRQRQPAAGPAAITPAPATGIQPAVKPKPPAAPAAPLAAVPLKVATPSEAQLQALLSSWLKAKAAVLAGGSATVPLEQMATALQRQRLADERRADAARGLRREVDARIERLAIVERTPRRIATAVDLLYSESRLGAGGETLGRSSALPLRNTYVFSREGDIWRLSSYRPLR